MKRIFVVGCSRSGTTLAQSCIASNTKIVTVPETAIFAKMIADLPSRMFDLSSESKSKPNDTWTLLRRSLRVSSKTVYQAFDKIGNLEDGEVYRNKRITYKQATKLFVRLMDRLAKENHADGWLEKTPSHVHYLDEIDRYIPDSIVIHVIRDGMSVVASLHDAAKRYPNTHWPINYPSISRCVARWNKCIADSSKVASKTNHFILMLDDLLDDTENTVRSLCDVIGIEYKNQMLSPSIGSTEAFQPSNEPWKTKVRGPISRKCQTKPEDIFTAEEIASIRSQLSSLDFLRDHRIGARSNNGA